MADDSRDLTVTDGEEHHAHIPVTDNGKAYCGTVKDKGNPFSVWSVGSEAIKHAIERCPDDLFLLDDNQLSKMADADHRLRTMRVAFQREYERVITYYQRTGQVGVMRNSNIYGGIVGDVTYRRWLERPEVIAYLSAPVVDYHDSLKALSTTILQRYSEILNAPLTDSKGRFSAATARVVLEAIKAVEDRVWGQSVQRVSSESKSVQVTVPVPTRGVAKTTDMMLVMEQKIRELQAELYGVRKLGEPGQYDAGGYEDNRSPDAWEANRILVKGEKWPEKAAKRLAKDGEVILDAASDAEGTADQAEDDCGVGGEGTPSP